MSSPLALPVIAGSLFAAVALGVHLGESSIGLINPIHFQGPAPHPRDRGAAIEEPLPAPARAAYHDLYGWEEGSVALAEECGDCASFGQVRVYSAAVPYFGGPSEPRRAAPDRFEDPHWKPAIERRGAEADRRPIERYAYYPVSEDDRAGQEVRLDYEVPPIAEY